ncbi:DNA (cytosine-5-)-methyltransferase [Lysobacteraceae bacterium NML93-0399]|nr:DNA (cytosine-5-)-methyltransferase [Xanthomonadaceae bacterium NML93-0399]
MDQRAFARTLRQTMTDAEQMLWRHLRAHRFDGRKFRRQQPIGPYVVDFVHFGARLIIEADGSQHCDSSQDATRDAWLKQQGFRVLRFWNHDILQSPESVREAIWNALQEAPLSPDPSPARGEGRQAESDSSPKIGSGK